MQLNPFKGGLYDLSRTIKSVLPGGDKLGLYTNEDYWDIEKAKQNAAKGQALSQPQVQQPQPVVPPVQQPAPQPIPQPVQPAPKPVNQYDEYLNYIRQGQTPQTGPQYTNKIGAKFSVPKDLYDSATQISDETGIPVDIIIGLAYKETGPYWNQGSSIKEIPSMQSYGVSNKGRGYFQIDLGQHPDVSEEMAFDPLQSARWATNYLKSNVDYYKDTSTPVANAIAAYNSGRGGFRSNFQSNPLNSPYYTEYRDNLRAYDF